MLARPKVISEGKDSFGKRVRWWAGKLGNSEVLSLLENCLGQEDPDIDGIGPGVNVNLTQFDGSMAYCDACLVTTQEPRPCKVCDGRYFCLCPDCDGLVQVRCSDGIHTRIGRED